MSFRCSEAALARGDELVGTASTVRAFVLLECPGPWGVEAIRDSRIPDQVKARLAALQGRGVRPLMIRGQGRIDGIRVFVAHVTDDRSWVETTVLSDVRELCDVDLDEVAAGRRPGLTAYDDDLFCVCTHGRHDACCAERGRPTWEAMQRAAPEQTWQVSHIGGDRFAANLLVLPQGLYYGRLGAGDARELVERHRDGRVDLEHVRGWTTRSFAAQAAEVFLRRTLGAAGERGLQPLPLVRATGSTFEFEVDGRRFEVAVARRTVTAMLTCRAEAPSAGWTFDVVRIAQAGD